MKNDEQPNEGLVLSFEAGIVATCRRCAVSWRVSGSRFQDLSWWPCPNDCDRLTSRAPRNSTAPASA